MLKGRLQACAGLLLAVRGHGAALEGQSGEAFLRLGLSAGLEEEDGDLTEVEVDEVLGLVGHVRAEVTADDAVPGGVVLFVELLLDESGDVLLNVEALEGLRADVDGILLHVLGHIGVLDDGFSIGHGASCFWAVS